MSISAWIGCECTIPLLSYQTENDSSLLSSMSATLILPNRLGCIGIMLGCLFRCFSIPALFKMGCRPYLLF